MQCNFASKSAKTKKGKERKKQHQNSDVEWWFWHPNLQEKTQNSIETKILEHWNFENKKFGIENYQEERWNFIFFQIEVFKNEIMRTKRI